MDPHARPQLFRQRAPRAEEDDGSHCRARWVGVPTGGWIAAATGGRVAGAKAAAPPRQRAPGRGLRGRAAGERPSSACAFPPSPPPQGDKPPTRTPTRTVRPKQAAHPLLWLPSQGFGGGAPSAGDQRGAVAATAGMELLRLPSSEDEEEDAEACATEMRRAAGERWPMGAHADHPLPSYSG